MPVFEILPKNDNQAFLSVPVALSNGGFAVLVDDTDFGDGTSERHLMLVVYKSDGAGGFALETRTAIEGDLPGVFSAQVDTLTIQPMPGGNLAIYYNPLFSDGGDIKEHVVGKIFTSDGLVLGNAFTLIPDRGSYQFLESDFDPRDRDLAVMSARDESLAQFDLFRYDDTGDTLKLKKIETFENVENSQFFAFDDGSLYAAEPLNDFHMTLLHKAAEKAPGWFIPADSETLYAVGNRIATVTLGGPVLHGKQTLKLFERGEQDAVAVRTLSHAGDGPIVNPGQNAQPLVHAIHGVGFAVLQGVLTAPDQVQYSIDVFDLDGDLVKTFDLDLGFAIDGFDMQGVVVEGKDQIKLVYMAMEEINGFQFHTEAASVSFNLALDLEGTSASDDIFGLGKNDKLTGFEGEDLMRGNAGNDIIRGGEGDDRLEAGAGNDRLFGDDGDDTIDAGPGGGNDELFGGDGNDEILGGKGDVLIRAGAGDDSVLANDGKDNVDGEAGNDEILGFDGDDRLTGSEGDDNVVGGKGNDRIDGGEGHDILSGGAGTDRLISGQDGDDLTGGAGRDIFVIDDDDFVITVIHDFRHGQDKIDLSALDLSFKALEKAASKGHFEIDVGGKEAALLLLNNVHSVDESDFIF